MSEYSWFISFTALPQLQERQQKVCYHYVKCYRKIHLKSKHTFKNICVLTEKQHKLKVENYALFGGVAEDLSLGRSLSDTSEALLGRVKEGSGYIGVLQ